MGKKLIIFATKKEAEDSISRLKAVATDPHGYVFEHGRLIISGIGLHPAQMAVANQTEDDEVWNLGIAGSLQDKPSIGTIFQIEKIGKYIPLNQEEIDPITEALLPPYMFLEERGARLISSDFPIYQSTHKQRIATHWDLVDMEGYGIAFACHYLGKKCRIWKIVSDFASSGGRDSLRKNLKHCSVKLAELLITKLNESSSN